EEESRDYRFGFYLPIWFLIGEQCRSDGAANTILLIQKAAGQAVPIEAVCASLICPSLLRPMNIEQCHPHQARSRVVRPFWAARAKYSTSLLAVVPIEPAPH